MSLTKQSKTLTQPQIKMMSEYLRNQRNGLRNQTIFLLSVKSGLRAKEISQLQWQEVIDSNAEVHTHIHLTNRSSKGLSGRIIPLHKDIRSNLIELLNEQRKFSNFNINTDNVIRTERSKSTSAQVIVNMFQRFYRKLNYVGCSSHSGRRTFITETAKKISLVGGSLRDIQYLSGHSSLQTTQRYIEGDSESRIKVVNLL